VELRQNDFKRARQTTPLILGHQAGHYAVAAWNDVGMVYWLHAATGPAAGHVHQLLAPVVETNPSGVSFIHVVKNGAGLPDARARQALTTMMTQFAGATVLVGVVLMGAGFWASAIQSALTGMRLMAPPRKWGMRFASRPADLSNWVSETHLKRTGNALVPAAIERAIEFILVAGQEAAA